MARRVFIEWSPDPIVFGDAILQVEEGLRHTEMPMALAMQEVQGDIRERFETETNPDGTPWAPWAESYENFAIEFPNIGVLRQTGELAEKAENALLINGDTLFFDEGQIWHQEGRERSKGGTLPERRFLGLSKETVRFIYAAFIDWFDNVVDLFETSTGRIGRRHARRGPSGTFIPRGSPMPMRIR
jgi:hypothetical protein